MRVRSRAPLRTCLGCRRVRPQAELLRIVRTPDGSVEPDPDRRCGGRGAYLCPTESCLRDAVRRARWAHAFRAAVALSPEAVAKVRAWIGVRAATGAPAHVEGGW